jgi:hypothetical protein
MSSDKTLKVTQVRSAIGNKPKSRGTLRALGLRPVLLTGDNEAAARQVAAPGLIGRQDRGEAGDHDHRHGKAHRPLHDPREERDGDSHEKQDRVGVRHRPLSIGDRRGTHPESGAILSCVFPGHSRINIALRVQRPYHDATAARGATHGPRRS